jgi:shikimate kinase
MKTPGETDRRDRGRTNLILIGLPASGKTTAGEQAARRLGISFVDTDRLIEEQEGCSLQEIVDRHGYLALRAIEEKVLVSLQCDQSVVATGGSAVYSSRAMTHLRDMGLIVWMDAGDDQVLKRLQGGAGRGLAKPADQTLPELLEERTQLYSRWSEQKISTALTVEETVERIESLWTDLAGRERLS